MAIAILFCGKWRVVTPAEFGKSFRINRALQVKVQLGLGQRSNESRIDHNSFQHRWFAQSSHDEHVIYRITENAKSPGRLALAGYKVVYGEELYMGDLDCRYVAAKSELQCHFKPTDSWIYKLTGDTMQGTLIINGNTLYRKINVKRVPSTPVKQP